LLSGQQLLPKKLPSQQRVTQLSRPIKVVSTDVDMTWLSGVHRSCQSYFFTSGRHGPQHPNGWLDFSWNTGQKAKQKQNADPLRISEKDMKKRRNNFN
jgi:hypothetical protein